MSRLPRNPPPPGGAAGPNADEPAGGGAEGADLALRTLSGFKWAFATAGGQALLSLAIAMTLARLLTPEDFGLLAIALVFLALADTAGRHGLGTALVQRHELTERHVATAFTFALAIALLLAAALWLLAPALCRLIGEPDAAPVLRTLSLAAALAGAGLVSEHLLRRRLRFRALMMAAILSQVIGNGLVAIGLALLDGGVWALVWGVVVRKAVFTLAVIAFEPVRPRLLAGRRETADLLRTGVGFSATAVFRFLANRGLDVAIAHTLGATALGLHTRAAALAVVSARLGPVLTEVLMPAMARSQHRVGRLRAVHRAGIEMLSLSALPASLAIAVCAPEIVAVLLGARWEGAVPALRILALAGVLQAFHALHVSVIRAMGAVYRETWRRAVFFVLLMTGAWFGSRWGLAGVAAASVVAWVVLQGLLAQLALGLLGTGWTALLRHFVPALWTGVWSTAALWPGAAAIRSMSLPPVAALALELALWAAAAAAAAYLAPRFARPAFPHWALAQLPFDDMGRAGPLLRNALAHLVRRWPIPLGHGPWPDPQAKAGTARALTSHGRGP